MANLLLHPAAARRSINIRFQTGKTVVSQEGRAEGPLDESAVRVIDGQTGAVRGKLCHVVSTSGGFLSCMAK